MRSNVLSNFCRLGQSDATSIPQSLDQLAVVHGSQAKSCRRDLSLGREPLDIEKKGLSVAHAHHVMGICPPCQRAKTQSPMGMTMGKSVLMKEDVRKRFAALIEATGMSFKAASLLAKQGETYVRDVIVRGRGKEEIVIGIVKLIAPAYVEWVRSGQGDAPPDIIEPKALNPQLPTHHKITIVGTAGAGGEARFLPNDDAGETLDVFAPEGTVAVRIQGVSLGSAFNGWYALYSDRRDPFTDDMYNELCVVGTDDDRVLVKWVRRCRGAGVALHSGIGEIEENVRLRWAARVISLQPR